MKLHQLALENFRGLTTQTVSFSPRCNLFFGANASGKTSLLEAIYFLSRARSFRTSNSRELINHQAAQKYFQLVAQLQSENDSSSSPQVLGMQRNQQQLQVRFCAEPVASLATLSRLLPVLFISPDAHRLLTEGAQVRRRFMDWGLFHTQPAFWPAWKRYQQALRQRNAGLRAHLPDAALVPWEQEMHLAAESIDQLRQFFIEELQALLLDQLEQLTGVADWQISYRAGQNLPLNEQLAQDRAQDRKVCHSRHGPHRADFVLKANQYAVDKTLSRGQQKLAACALLLAQTLLFQQKTEQFPLLLLDDMTSELDIAHRQYLFRAIQEITYQGGQCFVTALEPDELYNAWQDDPSTYSSSIQQGLLKNVTITKMVEIG